MTSIFLRLLRIFLPKQDPLTPFMLDFRGVDELRTKSCDHAIEMLNDDRTPMEFVVRILEEYFDMDKKTAVDSMLHIHTQGAIVIAQMERHRAEALAQHVMAQARARNYPLQCRVVPIA